MVTAAMNAAQAQQYALCRSRKSMPAQALQALAILPDNLYLQALRQLDHFCP